MITVAEGRVAGVAEPLEAEVEIVVVVNIAPSQNSVRPSGSSFQIVFVRVYLQGPRFAAFSKIWPLTILHSLVFILRTHT